MSPLTRLAPVLSLACRCDMRGSDARGNGNASNSIVIHASCIAAHDRAVLIRGAAGSGKSSLALQLMAYGGALVADDQVILTHSDGALIASCPATIAGLVEARGIGILHAAPHGPCPVALVIDLDHTETDRIPPRRSENLLGCRLPLLHNVDSRAFAAAILQYLKTGRQDAK